MPSIKDVVELIFQLPSEKYLAFKFISMEIVEDISFLLSEPLENGQPMLKETEKFI